MAAHSPGQRMERCRQFQSIHSGLVADYLLVINALLEVNLKSSARAVKHTDAVLLQTELDMLFFTHFMVNLYDITLITSSNTSLST